MTTRTRPAIVAGILAAALVAGIAPATLAEGEAVAKVRVLHASPDAPAVDVYADGAEILSDVPFGVISDYLEVPAGEHRIQVVAAGADPAAGTVIDATLTLEGLTAYTVAATNALAAIEAQVIVDAPAPTADAAQVRIVHLSADAPAVDIAPDGGAPIVAGLAYPDATDYLSVPSGMYDLEVRPAGTMDVALQIDSVGLFAGESTSIFAIGSLAAGTLQVLPALDAWTDVMVSVPAQVTIMDFGFTPGEIAIAAGMTVIWTNTGSAPHTVTFDDGSESSDQLPGGAAFARTFATPGTFAYICAIHPSMTGSVVVS